jgi:hypothetical protein
MGAGVIVLLSLLTLANVAELVLVFWTGSDEAALGSSRTDDDPTWWLIEIGLVLVTLVALGGAWLCRKWGSRLYLALQLLFFLFVLVNGVIGMGMLVPLALAGLLFFIGESSW